MKLIGLHHVTLQVPDFAASSAFITDFGLISAGGSDGRHYFRTCGASPYSVVLVAGGAPKLVEIAFEAESVADLDELLETHGARKVDDYAAPGGGCAVELTDPSGNAVRVVAGIMPRVADALPPPMLINQGGERPRVGIFQAKPLLGPPQLLRLGHIGLFITDWAKSDHWYRETLGLIPSDLLYAGPPQNVVGGFYRIDRGDEHVDHHAVAFFAMGKNDLHHISFEVQNAEAQFVGHRWLTQRQRESIWGVGRHTLGSHIFDVWRDPSGYRFETFSDTDVLNKSAPTTRHPIVDVAMDLWRDEHVEKYFA